MALRLPRPGSPVTKDCSSLCRPRQTGLFESERAEQKAIKLSPVKSLVKSPESANSAALKLWGNHGRSKAFLVPSTPNRHAAVNQGRRASGVNVPFNAGTFASRDLGDPKRETSQGRMKTRTPVMQVL